MTATKHNDDDGSELLCTLTEPADVALFFETAARCCFYDAISYLDDNIKTWFEWLQSHGVYEDKTVDDVRPLDPDDLEVLVMGTPVELANRWRDFMDRVALDTDKFEFYDTHLLFLEQFEEALKMPRSALRVDVFEADTCMFGPNAEDIDILEARLTDNHPLWAFVYAARERNDDDEFDEPEPEPDEPDPNEPNEQPDPAP